VAATEDIFTTNDYAIRYGVSDWVIRSLVDALGLGRKVGKVRLLTKADCPLLEAGLKARGHAIPAEIAEIAEIAEEAAISR
jgi:hypothetical protein